MIKRDLLEYQKSLTKRFSWFFLFHQMFNCGDLNSFHFTNGVCVRALSCFLLDDPGVIIHPFVHCVHCKEYHSKDSFSSHVHEQNNKHFLRAFGANGVKRNDLQYNVHCKTSKPLNIIRVIIWKIVNSENKTFMRSWLWSPTFRYCGHKLKKLASGCFELSMQ